MAKQLPEHAVSEASLLKADPENAVEAGIKVEARSSLDARIDDDWSEVEVSKGGEYAAKWARDTLKIVANDHMEERWTLKTLETLCTALKVGAFTEQDRPTIDAIVLDQAAAAFEKFINFIPALYLANPAEYEERLGEIFSKALQSAGEAQLTYVEVLLAAVDYRLLHHLHEKFIDRHTVELKQQSPFRKEILAWIKKSKDKVDFKKALFPIIEACESRTIEIAKVRKLADVSGPFYPDDDLVAVVDKICAQSKSFAFKFLGISFNSSGAFDDVRDELIKINERRKAGKLRALTDTVFSKKMDLGRYVRVLSVAYDKLFTQMETSAVNLNSANDEGLNEELKKNKAFRKVISELKEKLGSATAENAKLSPFKEQVRRLKQNLVEKEIQLRQLSTELSREKEARVKVERKLAEVQQQHKVDMAEKSRAAVELKKALRSVEADLKREQALAAELNSQNGLLKIALANQQKERVEVQAESLSAASMAELNSTEKRLPGKLQRLSSAQRGLSFYQPPTTQKQQNPDQPDLLTPKKERDADGPSAFAMTFTPGGEYSPN
jgi:hypothetical protein